MDGDASQTVLGIPRDEHAALDERVGVDLIPQRGGDLARAAGEIDLGRGGDALALEIAREVGFQVLGDAAPRLDELLVEMRLVLQVRPVGPEERP